MYLYAVDPSCLGEPCPTLSGQVKTRPHYRSGEEGSEAFTVEINVRFPLKICTIEGPAGGMRPRDLRSMRIPTPRHQNTWIRARSMTTTGNFTGKDTNPFSEGQETQLYYGRGKTGVPGEKTAARVQMMQIPNPVRDRTPRGNSHNPNQRN